MKDDGDLLSKYVEMQRAIGVSLSLKDVLDAAVVQISELANAAKVAIFLADHATKTMTLVVAKHYSRESLAQMHFIPFTAESILKFVVEQSAPVFFPKPSFAPSISAEIMLREGSEGEVGLPLRCANQLIGAVVLELTNPGRLERMSFLENVAEAVAMRIAHAMIFGRSEFERQRLAALCKSLGALGDKPNNPQESMPE